MKVLLVYTNRYRYLSPPPVGLAYLVPPLVKRGHEVKILDLMFSKQPQSDLEQAIDVFKPWLVGFSIRNLDNQSMLDLQNPLAEAREFVAIPRKRGINTVLGGTAFTTFPCQMLEYMQADYGIAGQGEASLPLLLDALENGKNYKNIQGLVYRENGDIRQNSITIQGYAQGKIPDWSLIDLRRYNSQFLTPSATVVVKSGCPFKCTFCDARITMGDQFILCDEDQIIDDIRTIINTHKVKWFFLNALCFNYPLDKTKKLLQRIIRERLNIRFMTRLYPIRGAFDHEFFELYKKAGGYFTMIDFSSFSDKMLENYKKPFNTVDIAEFGRMANKHGLKFGGELLFGGPGETHDTIRESMEFLKTFNYSMLSYALGIRISPHTSLYETALREGVIKETDNLLFSSFYITKEIDVTWAKRYIDSSLKKYFYRFLKMPPIIARNFFERFRG
jgi:radical SAM superfamily enzyme YgiQ (UPF0313 family)